MATQSKTKSWNIKEAILEAIGKGQSVINGLTKGAAQAELEVSRKNWIINGDMQVSQRGDYTSATAVVDSTYYLDRWKAFTTGVTSTVQDTGTSVKQAFTSTASGSGKLLQYIEDVNLLKGEMITVSAKVDSSSQQCRIVVYDGSYHTLATHSGSSTEETLSGSMTINSSATTIFVYIGITSVNNGNVSITSGDYIEFTNVKLEIGDTATPFESRSYADELALCQRYYYKLTASNQYQNFFVLSGISTTDYRAVYPHPVPMRTAPTIASGGTLQMLGGSTFSSLDVGDGISSTLASVRVVVTGGTTGDSGVLRANADTTAYIEFNAEI